MPATRTLLAALATAALVGAVLGACFNGEQSEGLPCTANSHCGPNLECIDGYCGGMFSCGDGNKIPAEDVCDGDPDCEDGRDESAETCGGDQFFCDDSSTVPITSACNGVEDCPDGSDEAPAVCDLYDLCVGDSEPFEFAAGPVGTGVDNPIGVFAGRLIGEDTRPELVIAGESGSFVRVVELLPEGPTNTDLPGDNPTPPYYDGGVRHLIVTDFEQDSDADILVMTGDAHMFAYLSDGSGQPPELAGDGAFVIPAQPDIVGLAMGRLNEEDQWADMVGVTNNGFVLTATGDPAAGLAGQNPFQLELSTFQVPGSNTEVVALADLDGDDIDELLIANTNGGPRLWILTRKAGGVVSDFWEDGMEIEIPFAASELAVGRLDDGATIDIALGSATGSIIIIRTNGLADIDPTATFDVGGMISGLAVVNFNCDGRDELVFNVADPPGIRVLFTDAAAGLDPEYSLTIDSAGRPAGKLALTQFDLDMSWDVFHAVEDATDIAEPQFRGFLTAPER